MKMIFVWDIAKSDWVKDSDWIVPLPLQ